VTELQDSGTRQQTYPPGTPIWNDVNAPDPAAARAFYTDLIGWDVAVSPDDQYGGYGMFLHDGKQVAGVGPTMGGDGFAAWSMYVLTEDAEETTSRVAAAGGQVVLPPLVVGTTGTMAIYTDPTGAFVGAWQPGTHKGADLFHTPGAVAWNELHSRDIAAASSFYAAVFGWQAEAEPFGDGEYTYWKIDGQNAAGGVTIAAEVPADVPSYWLVYISVPDCDQTVARALELGATVVSGPLTSEDGRYAAIRDPQGAVFGVISAPR
jgi:predicted enzyme related to lactoylglutathione lyase